MVHYDGTVRNSNKQLLQLRYGEDGMDGAKMEFQVIPSIKPPDAKFEQHFKFDCRNPRYLRKYLSEDIVRDLSTSTSVQAELEKEWQQLVEDRKDARAIFPTGNSKVGVACMTVGK